MPLSKQLKGTIGVHFIATQLARNNIIPAVTARNVGFVDIIASNEKGTRSVTIQVKTSMKQKGSNDKYIFPGVTPRASKKEPLDTFEKGTAYVKKKIQPSPTKFYAFVCLMENGYPDKYYIVPSKTVLNLVEDERKSYFQGKDIPQKEFKDSGYWHIKSRWLRDDWKNKNGIRLIENALK